MDEMDEIRRSSRKRLQPKRLEIEMDALALSPAKKSPAKKSPAKKSPAKKSPAKKSAAKKKKVNSSYNLENIENLDNENFIVFKYQKINGEIKHYPRPGDPQKYAGDYISSARTLKEMILEDPGQNFEFTDNGQTHYAFTIGKTYFYVILENDGGQEKYTFILNKNSDYITQLGYKVLETGTIFDFVPLNFNLAQRFHSNIYISQIAMPLMRRLDELIESDSFIEVS
jgi:hypothetical protein